MALYDGFDGNLLFGETASDGGRGSREIAGHQADVVAAFMSLHRRLLDRVQAIDRPSKWFDPSAPRDICDVGQHGGGGRSAPRAGPDEGQRRNPFAVDGDRV